MIRHSSFIKNIMYLHLDMSIKPKFGDITRGAINREQFVKYLDRHKIKLSEQKNKTSI